MEKGNDSVWRLIIRLNEKILFSVPLSVIFGEIGSNKSVTLEQTTLLGALWSGFFTICNSIPRFWKLWSGHLTEFMVFFVSSPQPKAQSELLWSICGSIRLSARPSCINFFFKWHLLNSWSKEVHALMGYFGPPMRPKWNSLFTKFFLLVY